MKFIVLLFLAITAQAQFYYGSGEATNLENVIGFDQLPNIKVEATGVDLLMRPDSGGVVKARSNTDLDNEIGKKFKGQFNLDPIGDADFGKITDFSTGNNSVFDGGGTIAGTFAVSTSSSDVIVSDLTRTYKYTQASGSANDYIARAAIDVPAGLRGNTLGYEFRYNYDGNSGEIDAEVHCETDGSNLATLALPANSSGSRLGRLLFHVPSSCTQIKWGFQVATENSGTVLLFDEARIIDNPLPTVESVQENVYSGEFDGSAGASVSTVKENVSGTFTVTRNSTGLFTVDYSSLNLTTPPVVVSTLIRNAGVNRSDLIGDPSTTSVQVRTFDSAAGTVIDHDFSIVLQLQGVDYREPSNNVVFEGVGDVIYSVPVTNEVENVYSATIGNNGTASIVNQSSSFIESVTRTSLGVVQINFTSGVFQEKPVVTTTTTRNDGFNIVSHIDTSVTYDKDTVTIMTLRGNNDIKQDWDFNIVVQRQGSDYRAPKGYLLGNLSFPVAIVSHTVASGGASGAGSGGVYVTRTLNKLEDPNGIVTSLSSNQFSLPEGTYFIEGYADAALTSVHKAKIFNTSDTTNAIIGSSSYADIGGGVQSSSIIQGYIKITSAKTFELRHWVNTNSGADTFGLATGNGDDEVYAQLKITKLR